jgi:plasmid stability protein
MATLQVRDIDDRLYSLLKTSAKLQNRSISQEVVTIIEKYLNSPGNISSNSTLEFLSLTGAWKDEKSADEIVRDIRNGRNQSRRFRDNDGLFD